MTSERSDGLVARLRGIEKVYGTGSVAVAALKGIDLDVKQGEFSACAGPSGSGKTTLLNLVGCLDRPTSGELILEGEKVAAQSVEALADVRERRIGFIFQSFNLIPVLTAYENVEFPLILRGNVPEKERRERVMTLLEDVALADMAHRRPRELSGGQQQRVAVARALIKEPALVLADEPTANLDSDTGRDILELMHTMNEKLGTTFLFSTHDPMVMHFARRLVRLHDGRVESDEQGEGAR